MEREAQSMLKKGIERTVLDSLRVSDFATQTASSKRERKCRDLLEGQSPQQWTREVSRSPSSAPMTLARISLPVGVQGTKNNE